MDRFVIGPDAEVLVGRDLVRERLLPPSPDRSAAAVLTQPGAEPTARRVESVLRTGGLQTALRVLPDRDDAKTPAVISGIWTWLAEIGLGRHDTVVGVGGGAVTDVAGFAAATWMRGIEAVQVPTTLLGAVDAAIGGKTGINVRGKNLVGAFWHPTRVVVDLDLVDGLPEELVTEGLAETVKAGFIGDLELVGLLEREGRLAPLEQIVPRAVAVKARVVGADFREGGMRAILNYGHTIGHAVEVLGGVSHGEAVSVGMVAAAAISERVVGFEHRERHDGVLDRLALPLRMEGLDPEQVLTLVALDKKRDATGVRMVLLEDVGRPVIRHIGEAELRLGLAAVTV